MPSSVIIPNLLDVTHVQNTGAAFGLLNAADFPYKSAVMIGIADAGAGRDRRSTRASSASHEQLSRYGLALILGGAFGNLIDRAIAGYVVDFVDVYWGDAHFWAFNVADAAITDRGDPRAARDDRDRTPPCIPSCLMSAGSPIYSYGVLLAAAYLLGLQFALVRARARGLDAQRVMDLGIWIIISALVGAKLLLLVVDFRQFTQQSRATCSTLAALGRRLLRRPDRRGRRRALYLRRHRLPLWTTTDVFAPGIALGHVVGRLGCLMAGCCFGRPTSVPWAITFRNPAAAAERRHAARRAAASDAALRGGRRSC